MSTEEESYVQELYKTLTYSNEQFDKQVLFIASGALGISFAFVEKLVVLEKACSKELLTQSWYVFATVIFVSLCNHFLSTLAQRWNIVHYKDDDWDNKERYWRYPIRALNVLMIIGLLIGTYLLISFIGLNI